MAFLTDMPLELPTMLAGHDDPGHGGLVAFVGRVRNHHAGRTVVALEYSAYPDMAEAVAAAVLREAESRWPVRASAAHRTGRLEVGDVAVVVVTSGGHRDEGYAANRWIIDALKARVPIWKREWYADGTSDWVDPTAGQPS